MGKPATLAILIAICALPASSFGQAAQSDEKLTAREMFYAAPPKPATVQKPHPVTPAKSQQKSQQTTDPTNAEPNGVHLAVSSSPYLGLRYTVMKENGDPVSPEAIFHSGDRIQLGIEVNDSGYLYIVSQGSSGTWKVLFPSNEIEKGDNRVEKGQNYLVPPQGNVFSFTGIPGVEKLFVILARRPVREMDRLIYSIQGGETEKEKPNLRVLRADISPLKDSLVESLRNSYSRDLIIEKMDSGQQGKQPEKAVYVVKPVGGSDSPVVADIPLNHQ